MDTKTKGRGKIRLPTPEIKGTGYLRKDIAPLREVDGRTIQHYTDLGLIIPEIAHTTGRGTKRKYSKRNVFELLLIKSLLEHGITLAKMKPIIRSASKEWTEIQRSGLEPEKLVLVLYAYKSQSDRKKDVYDVQLCAETKFTVSVEMTSMESVLVVDISEIIEKLGMI